MMLTFRPTKGDTVCKRTGTIKFWEVPPTQQKKKKKKKWNPVMSVLTRWCHWERVHSWPPTRATEPQWWCWTAGVCVGSPRGCNPSQCWKKTKQKAVAEFSISTRGGCPTLWQQNDERTWQTRCCLLTQLSSSHHGKSQRLCPASSWRCGSSLH